MGLFVTLNHEFKCIRCGSSDERSIQTKLLRTVPENSCQLYRVGDTEVIDGLDDYFQLLAWRPHEPLVVVVGDWDCSDCQLNWQWAKAIFEINPSADGLSAKIVDLSEIQPLQPDELAGVHYVESDLAELSGVVEEWDSLSVQARCEQISTGYRKWCVEVAGIQR